MPDHHAPVAGDPHADWPDRTTIADESGDVTLVFSASESIRDSTPWADGVWLPPGVGIARAVGLALDAMPGWVFSTSNAELARALLVAGAGERRHAHSMSNPLTGAPVVGEPAPGLRIEPLTAPQVDRHALRLGILSVRAYPPEHADAFDGDEAAAVSQVRAIARGEMLGQLISESRVALAAGEIVGACLVVDRLGEPPHGGPWVVDLFRDLSSPVRGIGSALLGSAIEAAREARLPALSLVVSHRNERARGLYQRLGFVDVQESWTLVLPEKDERPD